MVGTRYTVTVEGRLRGAGASLAGNPIGDSERWVGFVEGAGLEENSTVDIGVDREGRVCLAMTLTLGAGTPIEALLRGVELFRGGAKGPVGWVDAEVDVERVEVLPEKEHGRREAARREDFRGRLAGKLVGQHEAAGLLEVRPQRVGQLERERSEGRREDWPEPVAVLARGPIWLREDVVRFKSRRPPRRGPRPGFGGAPLGRSGLEGGEDA